MTEIILSICCTVVTVHINFFYLEFTCLFLGLSYWWDFSALLVQLATDSLLPADPWWFFWSVICPPLPCRVAIGCPCSTDCGGSKQESRALGISWGHLLLELHQEKFRGAALHHDHSVTVPRGGCKESSEKRWQDMSAELNKDPFCVWASTLYVIRR